MTAFSIFNIIMLVSFCFLFLPWIFGGDPLTLLIKKLTKHKENREERIKIERDGWFAFNGILLCWENGTEMEKWKKSIEAKLEICNWIQENTKSRFEIVKIGKKEYIRFNDDKDTMAFKLRWL